MKIRDPGNGSIPNSLKRTLSEYVVFNAFYKLVVCTLSTLHPGDRVLISDREKRSF